MDRFRAALAAGSISHDADPDLTRHLLNARLVRGRGRAEDDGHALYLLEKPGHGRLIDAAVASVLALEAMAHALRQPEPDGERGLVAPCARVTIRLSMAPAAAERRVERHCHMVGTPGNLIGFHLHGGAPDYAARSSSTNSATPSTSMVVSACSSPSGRATFAGRSLAQRGIVADLVPSGYCVTQ